MYETQIGKFGRELPCFVHAVFCQPKTPLGWFPAFAFKTVASGLLPELHVHCPPLLREGLYTPRVKFHQANGNGTYLQNVFYCWLFCSVSELCNNCLLIADLYLIQACKGAQRTGEAPTDCHIRMFWSCLVNISNKTSAISLDSTDCICTAIPRNNVHRYWYHFTGSCKGRVKFTVQAIWREVVDLFLPYSPSENSFLASLAYLKHLQRHSGSKITIRKNKYKLPRYDVG